MNVLEKFQVIFQIKDRTKKRDNSASFDSVIDIDLECGNFTKKQLAFYVSVGVLLQTHPYASSVFRSR